MALNAYLRLTGERQGEIKGDVTQAGREDSIMVIAFDHEVTVPIDPRTGRPTGRPEHGQLTITKEIDKSSPLLMAALLSHENVAPGYEDWVLRFWQPSPAGVEVQFYTIKLVEAMITAIRAEMLNNKYPENMQQKEREHVTFSYQRIEWTIEEGGIAAEAEAF